MLGLVYDLETTGLNVNTANVLEMAYLIIYLPAKGYTIFDDEEYTGIISGDTLYFWEDWWERDFSPEAMAVNGLTPEFLRSVVPEDLSDNYAKAYALRFGHYALIGKNNFKYDDPLLASFLDRNFAENMTDLVNKAKLRYDNASVTMDVQNMLGPIYGQETGTNRKGRLIDYITHWNLQPYVDKVFQDVVNVIPSSAQRGEFHCAMYDTVATLVCFHWYVYKYLEC